MKREELKKLGLTDEQIEAVMKSHGEAIGTTKQEKDVLAKQVETLQGALKDSEKSIKDLEAVAGDKEKLAEQIEKMKAENETVKGKYEQDMFDVILNTSLSMANPRTESATKAIKALLDKDSLKLIEADGKKVIDGLDKQLEALKENESYLFAETDKEEQQDDEDKSATPPYHLGNQHQGSGGKDDKDVFEQALSKFL